MKKLLIIILCLILLMASAYGCTTQNNDEDEYSDAYVDDYDYEEDNDLEEYSTDAGLINEWMCDSVFLGYPDTFILNDDGTGFGDGSSFTWYTKKSKIYFDFDSLHGRYMDSYYSYSISGNSLYLDGHSYHIRAEGEEVPDE